ncbi:hypothetical protein K443DRAFT_10019 [Laccaria amethystina LaAM-08-1]|uniref:Uncharacterized protein n=1 Tax=Laccaria amethystina LaAM-08-1 TaxID=1095629 RepID=A0A0C9XMB5_9AGAR|nr:hypothetical protein K443DRAFT_10019 [Laccaria amethystina LaAM-08-1]
MSSDSNISFLDSLSSCLLNDFRDKTFSTEFISDNAQIFLMKLLQMSGIKQFEIDDDPKAGLDEFSSATYGREEIRTSQAGPMCPSQGNEVLHMNYSLTGEFSLSCPPHITFIHAHSTNHGFMEEYWSSEPEDSVSYLDMLNDPSFPPTTSVISAPGVPENVDMSWASYDASSSSPTPAPTYNFDNTPAAAQRYFFGNVDYLPSGLTFGPTKATDNFPEPQPNPFLPPLIVDPSPPVSPNLVPQESVVFPDNPHKWLRIPHFTEENILPDNQSRKRSKPDKLSL